MSSEVKNYSIAKAGAAYTLGNLFIKGLPFFSIPLFVRILTTSDFGLYNTYIALENILSVVFGMGISGTIKTARFDYHERFEEYVSSIYLLMLLLGLGISIAGGIIYTLLPKKTWVTPLILCVLLLHSFATAIFTVNGVKLVILGKYIQNLAYTFLVTVGNIGISLVLCLCVFTENRYIGRIIGTAAAFVIAASIILILQAGRSGFLKRASCWNYALKMGIPLVPHLVSVMLLSSCDKIMIQKMAGNAEAGIYSLAVNLVAILTVFLTSIENAWAPWFYTSLNTRQYREIMERNSNLILLFMYLTSGFILIGPELIRGFSTPEYENSLYALIPLAVSVFLNFVYLIPVNLEYFHKKTYFISLGTILCALINLALNYIFIGIFGYLYAAHATCISKGILMLIHCFIMTRLERNRLFSPYVVMLSIGGLLLCSFISEVFAGSIFIRWGYAAFVSLALAAFVIGKQKGFIERRGK